MSLPVKRPTQILWASLGSIGIAGFLLVGVGSRRDWLRWLLISTVALLVALGLTACGGEAVRHPALNPNATPPGSYSVTVTALAKGISTKNMTLTIIVR